MRRFVFVCAVIIAVGAGACSRSVGDAKIVKSTSCKGGAMTYLGFKGTGTPPPALLDEIKKRFPDAEVLEVEDGNLGVVIPEGHSFGVRARHEAAAAAVGWKGNVVDFPHVTKDCVATFTTPVPMPQPPTKTPPPPPPPPPG